MIDWNVGRVSRTIPDAHARVVTGLSINEGSQFVSQIPGGSLYAWLSI